MKDMGIVQGSAEQAKPLIINKDTVYVHTDITLLPDTEEVKGMYEYHEVQYELYEYLNLYANQTKADIDYLAVMGGVEL